MLVLLRDQIKFEENPIKIDHNLVTLFPLFKYLIFSHLQQQVTTDWRLGSGTGCTDKHTGTSAAAPLAAGMIALMFEARPCLTWRDVQSVIVYTARRIDIEPDEWQVNSAGFAHSHKHGFGILDSWALVTASKVSSVLFLL